MDSEGGICCPMRESCVTQEVWAQIEQAINRVVDHITLADLVKRHNEKNGGNYII